MRSSTHCLIDRQVRERLASGEPVTADEYYLRTAPFFETAAPEYAWLNTIISGLPEDDHSS